MKDELLEGIKASYDAFVSYFLALRSVADDPETPPPMSYEELGDLDSELFKEYMISETEANPSWTESAVMDSLLLTMSATRDMSMRNMSRKDYYEDSNNTYLEEAGYHMIRRDVNVQYINTATPKQST